MPMSFPDRQNARWSTLQTLALMALLSLVAGCSDDDGDTIDTATGTIPQELQIAGFATLLNAAEAAGLAGDLETQQDLTLFAPADAAFGRLDPGTLNDLTTTDTPTLANILRYHLVAESLTAAELADDTGTGLVSLTTGADRLIVDQFPDGDLFINQAAVTTPDINATNGIVHGIDRVLLPPASDPVAMLQAYNATVASPSFTTFLDKVAALPLDSETVVVSAIASGDNTLFVPTDAAFDRLAMDFDALPTAEQVDILTYHVHTDSSLKASQAIALSAETITMANSDNAAFTFLGDDRLLIQSVPVILFNLPTDDGSLIHGIEEVLMPPTAATN